MEHEATIRLAAFLGVFTIMATWELLAPRRVLDLPRQARWPANLAIVAIDTLILRLLFPGAAVGVALIAKMHGWGIFNAIDVPFMPAVVVSIVLLDFTIWLQHVVFHAIPVLWRLHRVHHADLGFDVTTGLRFHPIEIVLSMLIKFAAIILIGAPALAVIAFEIILNAGSLFNHGNVRLPFALDRVLRFVVVTPDMHRVHHSVIPAETNSNFGFSFSIWDRLGGTYRAQPREGHEDMTIGLKAPHDAEQTNRLWPMLAMPFTLPVRGYAINRRGPEGD